MSKEILIIGYIGDSTSRHILEVTQGAGVKFSFLHLKDYYSNGYLRHFSSEESRTRVHAAGVTYWISEFSGIYQRLMLPTPSHVSKRQWPKVVSRFAGLNAALQSTQIKIVNIPQSGWENMSKLLQSYLLMRKGFTVPLSLTTSIISDYQTFRQHGETIYKSNSGVRSIVDNVDEVEKDRLQFLENCPVLFQRRIVGKDVRIHVVDDSVFAVEIESDAVDYRYYRTKGTYSHLRACESCAPQIAELCRSYAKERGIVLAGFDFKVDEAGNWYCLEMNPSPGFETYDHVLEGRIGKRVLEYLLDQSL